MMHQVCLLLVLLLAVSVALHVSTFNPFYREGESQGENSAEAYARFMLDNPNHRVYRTGFLRTDIYEGKLKTWVRAEVLPIGTCFKEGSAGGSAAILQILMGQSYLLRVVNVYAGSDCGGGYETILLSVPIVKIVDNLRYRYIIRHEAKIEKALSPSSDGLIIKSYYSSEGCIGEAAQYDLVSTGEYIVYDEPINSCGLFKCLDEIEMIVFKVFRGYHGGFHPFCNPGGTSNSKSVASVFTNFEQPFACTEEPSEGDDKQVDFPLFQTVRCAFAEQDSTASPDPELVLFNNNDIYAHVDEGRE